jgi:WD40 repeat protein/serine/threonine protein kinase
MTEFEDLLEQNDAELAELLAEISDRLRRGERVLPGDYGAHADALSSLLPTLRRMTDLPPDQSVPFAGLGQIGDFRLLREVSRGGMGVVYEAMQVSLGRRVALKILPAAAALDPRHLERFRVEAQAAASLCHPNIVPVYATSAVEGVPYYAMRFVDGRDLACIICDLRAGSLEDTEEAPRESARPPLLRAPGSSFPRDVATLARQAAEALEYAHANDVIHRDIKPSNLLIDHTGHLWITDFGLARIRGGVDLTHTGDAPGTPRYMSPEQTQGRRTAVDGRSDIYSLGVTLYEVLTGQPAFPGDDRLEVMRKIASEEPVPPRMIDPTIPADLETIVLRAMAKDPEDRYPAAADLAADLGRFLNNRPIVARRPSVIDKSAKWMFRHRRLVTAAASAVLVLAVACAGGMFQYAAWLKRHNAALRAEVDRADRSARDAGSSRALADSQRRLADRHFMAAQLRLAQRAVESQQFEVAQDLLEAIQPDRSAGDTDDFAWRYLDRLATRELVRLPERAAQLREAVMAGDGKTLAAWYSDDCVVIWDVVSELPVRTMEAVNCRSLAISQDGRTLAAEQAEQGRTDFTQRTVWDTATGQVIGQMTKDRASLGRPSWLHLLAGGRVLACRVDAGDGSHSVQLTRIENICKDSQKTHTVTVSGITTASFVPDAEFWFACDAGKPKVRDAFTGAARLTLPGAYENVVDVACSANGQLLAVGCKSGLVVVIDRATGAEVARHDFQSNICLISLSPAGDVVSEVDLNGALKVWNRNTGQTHVFSKDGVGQCLRAPTFSRDGSRMATLPFLSPVGMKPAVVWDVASGRRIDHMPTQDHPGRLWFASDSRTLFADGSRSPRIWHLDPPSELPSPAGHLDEAWSAAYSADGKLLATGSDDTDEPHTIKLWNPVTAQLVRAWCGGVGTVASLAFSPDGRILVSGHLTPLDGVRIWDVSTGRLLNTLRGHKDMVRSVAFSPDGRLLATGGGYKGLVNKDWNIRIWDLETSRCVRILEGHSDVVRAVAFSPDGRSLASASYDQTLRLWDVGTGQLLRTARCFDHLIALAFLPNEGTLAAAQENGAITIHDAGSLAVTKTIRGESDPLRNIAVTPDGRSIATCSLAGKIRFWDTLTGQEVLTLQGHKAQVNGIAFSPDGFALTSCSHDGAVKIWRAQ